MILSRQTAFRSASVEFAQAMQTSMGIYHHYAPFYDGSGQIRFAVLVSQYLDDLLARHPVAGRQALDLACGTGTLALLLADRGWSVVGLDASQPMLRLARAKAANLETLGDVRFVHGDMRRLLPEHRRSANGDRHSSQLVSPFILHPSSFDLVTCTYDSLNYLLDERELAACFSGVAQVLRPGGLFVADMNTRYFLEHDWDACQVQEAQGFVQVAQSRFDPVTACSTMVLTGFSGDDEQGYERFEETHVERAYPPEQVALLLAEAGLVVEATYDCFTLQPIYERSQRIAWVGRKPAV